MIVIFHSQEHVYIYVGCDIIIANRPDAKSHHKIKLFKRVRRSIPRTQKVLNNCQISD